MKVTYQWDWKISPAIAYGARKTCSSSQRRRWIKSRYHNINMITCFICMGEIFIPSFENHLVRCEKSK